MVVVDSTEEVVVGVEVLAVAVVEKVDLVVTEAVEVEVSVEDEVVETEEAETGEVVWVVADKTEDRSHIDLECNGRLAL